MKVAKNRLANVGNNFQGHFPKVLCVCSAGLLRSPTLAYVLSLPPFMYNTRAVGTDAEFALIPIDLAHVAWADQIVVMDEYQKMVVEQLQDELEEQGRGYVVYHRARIVVMDVPDQYGYRDPTLVEILTEKCYEVFGEEVK
jgi:predicted protein tyrosine phosphatase